MHNGVAIRLVLIYDLVVVAANNLTGDTNEQIRQIRK
jgi:hypothetical protein